MSSDVDKYLTPEVIQFMQEEIAESNGNEVFFVGYTKDCVVVQVKVIARGNQVAVPAIQEMAKKSDVVIHNHPSGALTPSEPDLAIATRLEAYSVAFYIVDNDVRQIYVVVEPFENEEIKPLNFDELKKILLPGGAISQHLNGYEDRPQQIEMIDYICQAFNQNKVTMIEAGTGTGKTLAYLLPAIHWALLNKERIVISTNTINLQEQLLQKDIPLLKKALKEKFDAVLVKGRSNYACQRKVEEIEIDVDFLADEGEKDELLNLVSWAKKSKDGSRSDLSYVPKENVWEKISAESDTCLRNKCHFFRECFVNKARRHAAKAHILIVNHHLMFSDLSIRHSIGGSNEFAVLPPYQRIIFDESHNLEDVATQYFGSRVTRNGILRILNRLFRRQKSNIKGHLHSLRNRILLNKESLPEEIFDKFLHFVESELVQSTVSLVGKTHLVMDRIYEIIELHAERRLDSELKIRLLPHVLDHLIEGSGLAPELKEYISAITGYIQTLNSLVDVINMADKYFEKSIAFIGVEIRAQAERLFAIAQAIEKIFFSENEQDVRWIEVKPVFKGYNIVRFLDSPLDISQIIKSAVYDTYETVVMTSATLTVDNKFDFLAERIGASKISRERITQLLLGAPFDFERQVVIAVPVDMPDPSSPAFNSECMKVIFKTLTITNGRAFILFTSYGMLNSVYEKISESLSMLGIRALKQGDMNRHELLRLFKTDKNSVLFGTSSFWEGVDVEGDALELVVITKLPFKVPSEPIIEARYEFIERNGGNAFMDYAVPLAVIKLKQGFGRLIRRKTDRGAVVILDKRVIQKGYGKRFLRSLPDCHQVFGTRDEVFGTLTDFYKIS
ncbi:DEAD/DEAH box helicase [candidate division KSB1 bacterium]|nr:DEAD/DEAH box helicase [candidate division KSB1 bacterium]